jgi:hypothetical protein
MGAITDYIRQEGGVIARAPVAFLIGAIIVAGATWVGATAFYKQEVAAAKQETAGAKQETAEAKQETQTVGEQRDFYRDRLNAEIKAAPAVVQGAAPSTYKAAPLEIRPKGTSAPKVVSSTPPPAASSASPASAVTSYFQSGGITAGAVNLGPQQRVLTDDMKRQLLDKVPKEKPVTITAVLGDGEAFAFATDLFSFMKANGFKMAENGISQAIFTAPVTGTSVQLAPDKTDIVVGTNLPSRP